MESKCYDSYQENSKKEESNNNQASKRQERTSSLNDSRLYSFDEWNCSFCLAVCYLYKYKVIS